MIFLDSLWPSAKLNLDVDHLTLDPDCVLCLSANLNVDHLIAHSNRPISSDVNRLIYRPSAILPQGRPLWVGRDECRRLTRTDFGP